MNKLLAFLIVPVVALSLSSDVQAAESTNTNVVFRNLVTTHDDVAKVVIVRTDDLSREIYIPQGDGSVVVKYRFAEYRDSTGDVVCPEVRTRRHFTKHDFFKVTLQYRLDNNHAIIISHTDGTVETFTNPDQTYEPICLME